MLTLHSFQDNFFGNHYVRIVFGFFVQHLFFCNTLRLNCFWIFCTTSLFLQYTFVLQIQITNLLAICDPILLQVFRFAKGVANHGKRSLFWTPCVIIFLLQVQGHY